MKPDKKTRNTVEKLVKKLQHEAQQRKPDVRLIRQIAGLSVKVPDGHTETFKPDNGPQKLKGDFTLGKACLLGTRWNGNLDLKRDGSYITKYMAGAKIKQVFHRLDPWHEIQEVRCAKDVVGSCTEIWSYLVRNLSVEATGIQIRQPISLCLHQRIT